MKLKGCYVTSQLLFLPWFAVGGLGATAVLGRVICRKPCSISGAGLRDVVSCDLDMVPQRFAGFRTSSQRNS